MYVSEFALEDYPVRPEDVLHTGPAAFDAALNTVNVGKFNLGFCAIGVCEHAFYETVTHADARVLFGQQRDRVPAGAPDPHRRLRPPAGDEAVRQRAPSTTSALPDPRTGATCCSTRSRR